MLDTILHFAMIMLQNSKSKCCLNFSCIYCISYPSWFYNVVTGTTAVISDSAQNEKENVLGLFSGFGSF